MKIYKQWSNFEKKKSLAQQRHRPEFLARTEAFLVVNRPCNISACNMSKRKQTWEKILEFEANVVFDKAIF